MVCTHADIIWTSDGMPRSTLFDDIYFSPAGGIEETDYVFLKGNGLERRWSTCSSFTIAETGFGTGLNFLCARNLWKQTAPHNASLHYISIEKFPLKRENLTAAYNAIGTLDGVNELIEQYPENPSSGYHHILFDNNITLTILFADVLDALSSIAHVDAWFLDGFSPAKNPDMWSSEVLKKVGAATKSNGTFATFTCARAVRDGLAEGGFIVEKIKGFATKRHMLIGAKQ